MLNKPRSRSLSSLFLLLIVLSVIPAFIYILISAEQLRTARADSARDDALRITRVLASYQSSVIESTGDLLAALSHGPVIRGEQWQLCNQFLRGVLAGNPRYANLGVIDPEGRIVCSGVRKWVDIQVDDRSYFQRALTAAHYAVGDFHVGRITGEKSLGIGYAIRGADNEVRHVLFASLKTEALAPPIDEVPFRDNSTVKVFDSKGTLLAAIPRDDARVGLPIEPPQLLTATRERTSGAIALTTVDDEEWLYTFAGVGNGGREPQIRVALAAPLKDLLLQSERRYWRELLGAVLALGSVLAIGWLLANAFILRQLQSLASAAKRIAGGDFNARAAFTTGHGELVELADHFNTMADRVQQQVDQLQQLGVALGERNQLLSMMVQGVPLQQIMVRLVQLMELQIPGAICSVLRVDPEQRLHHLVAPHLSAAYTDAIDGEKIGPNRGSCGAAAFTGEAVITADIATDPRWEGFRELAFAHNLHACWSHPIIASAGRVLGTFAMYFHQPRTPSDDELALLDVAHNLAAIAIEAHDLAARDRQLEVLLDSTSEGIYGVDTLGRIAFANRACVSLLGYESADELVGRPAHQTLHHSPLETSECDGSDCPIHRAMSTGLRNHADDQVFWHREGFPVPVEYWYYPVQQGGATDGAIVTFFDITERHAQREALAWQATHDALTGLPNRNALHSALERSIAASDHSGQSFALLLIDLDQFKEINDTLGHHAGDQLLRTLGPRLSASLAVGEIVVRLGGDEFAVVLQPDLRRDQVSDAAMRLLLAIEEPAEVQSTRVQVGASIGAAFYPDDGANAEELLRCADVAMYSAKHNHLRYAAYESLFDDKRPERLALMSDLRAAISTQQLSLYYQPKVDLADGALAGLEALARWHHPTRGLVSPGEFVPWIERSDLINPFTGWVLEAAVAQCALWRGEGFAPRVSVNISTGNLLDTRLADRIAELLQRYEVPAAQLELEITESSIMANPSRSLEVVAALRQLGLSVSIDDFGTGYSSLGYLQRLPVNYVKIDGSFVRGLLADDGARLIVSAIIDLSHKLGLEVVAEGVEDAGVAEVLRAFGCDQAQGYHYARPMPAGQALSWMQEHGASRASGG